MSIAAAKEMELSFKLSAAAGRHSHAFAQMQTCGWYPATRGQVRELSKAFLDLPRQASEKDLEWQATRDAVLRKNENVEVKDNLLHHGNRWVHPMIQPSSYAFRARIMTLR
jgi:hypothetical protein